LAIHLETKNLSIGYSRGNWKNILHSNINISLEEGEFASILGPNGSGKSSLLKTFAGFIPKISGKILIQNEEIDRMSEHEKSKKVSIVLTERPIVADMTVFELIALGRTPFTGFFGKINKNDKIIIEKALTDVGLEGYNNRFVSQLSDGECQKAFIAKALVQQTPVLLLDEPTAFLDLPSRVEIMHLLRDLAHTQGKTILLSTHDLELALQTADKILLMNKKFNLRTGFPEELALAGDLKTFFEKDGIIFDYLTGQFIINKEDVQKVRLIGTGVEYKWIKNAILRNGFAITDSQSYSFKIEINNENINKYFVTIADETVYKLSNIKELLELLKNMKKK
jgi:iron complex transport system ATP-binding protein